jgi:Uma2 family endonuclease
MSEARLLPPPLTVAAFDTFLDGQHDDTRWELVDGHILAMTNPSLDHAEIVGNIAAALRPVMPADRRCRITTGDVRVQASEDVRGTYAPRPDVMVWCGPMDGRRNFVTTPQVIVEVLSPSSMDNDRGAKLRFYKTRLQTLRQIVLVYQDQMRIESYERTDAGWELTTWTRPDEALVFAALVHDMKLSEVYAGVALPSA